MALLKVKRWSSYEEYSMKDQSCSWAAIQAIQCIKTSCPSLLLKQRYFFTKATASCLSWAAVQLFGDLWIWRLPLLPHCLLLLSPPAVPFCLPLIDFLFPSCPLNSLVLLLLTSSPHSPSILSISIAESIELKTWLNCL